MSVLVLVRWAWARDGGTPARKAVIRWGVRLFRREWRQLLLVFGLLTVAAAVAGWLLAGRQPSVISRQPLE